MKKLVFLIAILLCISTLVCALPAPTNMFYAADFANLLSDETEGYIINHSNTLCEKTKAQIVVATVNDMGGKNEREYGIELAREWKIGSEDDNGVLILVALDERKISIEVGYGLEGALNDAKTGRLMDNYALPHLRNNDFDTGILNLYKAVLAEVYNEYGLEVPESVDMSVLDEEDDIDIASIIVTIIFAALIIVSLINTSNKGGGSGGAFLGGYLIGKGTSSHYGGSKFGGGFGGGGGSFGGGGSSRGF